MTSEIGIELHDRATRGDKLTAAEQAELEAWYKMEDEAEAALLGQSEIADNPIASKETIALLRQQINTILADLAEKTTQIQLLTEQNQSLRDENASLRQFLVQQTAPKAT